jgi:hypothetical protein
MTYPAPPVAHETSSPKQRVSFERGLLDSLVPLRLDTAVRGMAGANVRRGQSGYSKRQVPPPANFFRIRRATTIRWTSSGPS